MGIIKRLRKPQDDTRIKRKEESEKLSSFSIKPARALPLNAGNRLDNGLLLIWLYHES